MSLDIDLLQEACQIFPRSAKILRKKSIEQIQLLEYVRSSRMHLHKGNNIKDIYYRVKQLKMEKRAPEDLSIDLMTLTKAEVPGKFENI